MAKKYSYVRKTMTFEGKRYEVTGKTEQEALEKLAELKVALQRGERVIRADSTVDRWFQEWMDLYKRPAGLTPKSLGMYDEKYRNYIKPAIGAMKLKDVKEVHLQRILNGQAGMSYSHVSKLRLVLQEMFSKARKTRLLVYDPSEDLKLPAVTRGTNRSITEEERAHILQLARTHRSGLWVLTILYSGMRPGETAALFWRDVDFERNEIHISKALESGMDRIKATKTAAGVRDVPIHMELRKRLLEVRGEPDQPVFPTGSGGPQNHKSLRRLWDSFARDLDIRMGATVYRNKIVESVIAQDLTPYCLRHTFCTDLQRAGVPINVAKELMGHSDIAVTANIYTHKDAAVLHENMVRLAESQIVVTTSAGDDVVVAFGLDSCYNSPREMRFALGLDAHADTFGEGFADLTPVENSVENVEEITVIG